jgi:hypothetical protein
MRAEDSSSAASCQFLAIERNISFPCVTLVLVLLEDFLLFSTDGRSVSVFLTNLQPNCIAATTYWLLLALDPIICGIPGPDQHFDSAWVKRGIGKITV